MKTKKIQSVCAFALETGTLVRLSHAPEPKVHFDGYIVGLSADFVALHSLDGDLVCLNGYSVFPTSQILTVRRFDDYGAFFQRALALKGIFSARPRNISFDGFSELLSSVDAHFPLVTIHTGHLYPDECYIGRVAKLSEKAVTLREINPAAHWKRLEKYKFRDITRIDFAGGYEEALWRVSENERSLTEKSQGSE